MKLTRKSVDKLDEGFLFALGLVGLAISFIQVALRDPFQLAAAIPFVTLGVMWPFYVGYMRGAIELNCIQERLRGWICLLVGTFSYFAFFAATLIRGSYVNLDIVTYCWTELLVALSILLGLAIAYKFMKWVRRIFRPDVPLNQYALSGTAFCAGTLAFLSSLVIGYTRDLYGRDVFRMIFVIGSPEPLFWFSIIFGLLSVAMIIEKAAENMVSVQSESPDMRSVPRRLRDCFLVRGLVFGAILLDYTSDFKSECRVLWQLALEFWVLGSIFLAVGAFFVSGLLLVLATGVAFVADIIFCRAGTITFRNIGTKTPEKVGYILWVFLIICAMVLSGNVTATMVMLVLVTVAHLLPHIGRTGSHKN